MCSVKPVNTLCNGVPIKRNIRDAVFIFLRLKAWFLSSKCKVLVFEKYVLSRSDVVNINISILLLISTFLTKKKCNFISFNFCTILLPPYKWLQILLVVRVNAVQEGLFLVSNSILFQPFVLFFSDSSREYLKSLCNLSENMQHLSSYFEQSVTALFTGYLFKSNACYANIVCAAFEVDTVSEFFNKLTLGFRLLPGACFYNL